MASTLWNFLINIFKSAKLTTFFVSMVPLIELKGAIPLSTKGGIDLLTSASIAYLGSTLIVIPIFFLLIPIFNLIKKIPFFKNLVLKIEGVFQNKADKISQKANGQSTTSAKRIMIWSLFIFVAVPFPVTGVWTGTAIAVFLGLKFKESILPLAVGNFIAGTLITIFTLIFGKYTDLIIYCLFAIAIIMLIVFIIKIIKAEPKKYD